MQDYRQPNGARNSLCGNAAKNYSPLPDVRMLVERQTVQERKDERKEIIMQESLRVDYPLGMEENEALTLLARAISDAMASMKKKEWFGVIKLEIEPREGLSARELQPYLQFSIPIMPFSSRKIALV